MTTGAEVVRRLTDGKGSFRFDGLRPGAWRLMVYDNGLPEYYFLETPEQDLTLAPGQTAELVVRVLPKAREIRWLDQGTVRAQRPDAGPTPPP